MCKGEGFWQSFSPYLVHYRITSYNVCYTKLLRSALIEDIEQLAQRDTTTNRQILLNGRIPDPDLRYDPKKKLIAQLSQNMNFLADMSVEEFLKLHAKCRGKNPNLVDQVIEAANALTGEPIRKDMNRITSYNVCYTKLLRNR